MFTLSVETLAVCFAPNLPPLQPITFPSDTEIDLSGAGTPIGVALLTLPAVDFKIKAKKYGPRNAFSQREQLSIQLRFPDRMIWYKVSH